MTWIRPRINGSSLQSSQDLPDNIMDQLNQFRISKSKSIDSNVNAFIDRFERKHGIRNNNHRTPLNEKAALGKFSEGCIDINLHEGWEFGLRSISKWDDYSPGASPGRGLDILTFSPEQIKDERMGIWLFEVKGALSESSLSTQSRILKSYSSESLDDKKKKDLLEMNAHIRFKDDLRLADFLIKKLVHFGAGLVTLKSFESHDYIRDLKNTISTIIPNVFSYPGLITLFSDELPFYQESTINGYLFYEDDDNES